MPGWDLKRQTSRGPKFKLSAFLSRSTVSKSNPTARWCLGVFMFPVKRSLSSHPTFLASLEAFLAPKCSGRCRRGSGANPHAVAHAVCLPAIVNLAALAWTGGAVADLLSITSHHARGAKHGAETWASPMEYYRPRKSRFCNGSRPPDSGRLLRRNLRGAL